ncbi:hypothetical protein V9T40_002489 [Parthenolecanium corni]|uniref:FACT complex subunit n=1 Tax=Parthenolecanium corni TaxID=536013 RepID=A0AAN9TIK7_9HEMI
MSNPPLDKENFFRRMKRLYAAWKDGHTEAGEPFPKVDSICIAVGNDNSVLYCKSLTVEIWLLGYDIYDLIMIFTENTIHFMASKKKIDFLRQIEQHRDENSVPPVKLYVRNKDGNEKENFDKLISALKGSGKGKSLGVFGKDNFPGPFVESWKETLKGHSFESIDISNAIASLLSIKEESELSCLRKASSLTTEVYHKYLREQIMDIIDNDKKFKHSKLAEGVANTIADSKYIGNLDPNSLDMCYAPIIQSGGNYSLKFSAQSDKNNLHFGIIICSFGIRYKMYCSNIIRTLMVNPADSVQENYNFLVDLEEHLCGALKSGVRLCDVYNSGISFAKEKKPNLVENLTKNFGFVCGIEFRETSLTISGKTTACARKSQVYNLNVGLSGLVNNSAESKELKNYSLFVGDTVIVNENAPVTLLTLSKKRMKNVSVFLKDNSDEEEEEESDKDNEATTEQIMGRGKRTAVLDSKLRTDSSSEEKRKQHQKELALQLNEVARQRLSEQSSGKESTKIRKSNVSYKHYDQIPNEPDIKELKIYVDRKYETVILPIFGLPVPFHISTIKNISQSVEGDYTYLRINFFHPGTMARGEGSQFSTPEATFCKEVTYRSTNLREPGEVSAPSSNLNNAFRLIKEVQKKFKTREAEEKEKEDLVKQDTLVISSNKGNPKLKDLYMRPTIVNKRMTGTLEAHANGFRYTSVRGDKVDILYNNIKHAFFQPCDGEMIILLHFHLKHAIMFGKKKHLDVQFYTEVGEITTDLGKHQHMHDRDDLAAEQAERELRMRLKTAFKSFCEKVEASTKQEIEFDTPFKELGFHGAPYRSTVLLQPTSGCLVNLTEWPPFVVTLEDVELVHFERVQFSLKNFDMVFVFKDYHSKVVVINAIPMNMLDHVKEWLNQCDILYSEGIQSLNWAKIMKTIVDDPDGFFEQGGWTFLGPASDDEAEHHEEDSSNEDEAYEPTTEESAEDESDDSEYSEASEDSDTDEEAELDSDEESGKDWSDLEEEAMKDDMQRQTGFNDEYASSKKGKSTHSARPSHSSGHSSKSKDRDRGKSDSHRDKKHGSSSTSPKKSSHSSSSKHNSHNSSSSSRDKNSDKHRSSSSKDHHNKDHKNKHSSSSSSKHSRHGHSSSSSSSHKHK